MQKVATAWLVYQMTGSEAWLGIDAFASGIPTVLLLPLGGVIADRIDRRTLLIWTNLILAILALLLAGLEAGGVLQVWHIIAVSAASGVVQSVMVPAGTSLLPKLVGEEDVPNAIALNSLQFNLSRVVGPAVGGVTLVYLGAAWSFGLNALSFIVLVLAFIFIKTVPPVPSSKESVWKSLKGGLMFVRDRSDLAMLLLLVVATALLGAPVVSMLPALVKMVLHREATSYSMLLSAFGAGAVVAGLLIAMLDKGSTRRWLTYLPLIVLGVAEAALGFGGSLWLATTLVAVSGLTFVGTMIRLGTAILQTTPDEFRGRVTAFQQMAFRAAQPLGALLAGTIARALGVPIAFWSFGLVLILCIICVALWHGHRGREC